MSGVTRGALWAALALLAFFCADSLLFRTGWYNAFLEPDSSAGALESHLHWLRYATVPRWVPDILVVGDPTRRRFAAIVTATEKLALLTLAIVLLEEHRYLSHPSGAVPDMDENSRGGLVLPVGQAFSPALICQNQT